MDCFPVAKLACFRPSNCKTLIKTEDLSSMCVHSTLSPHYIYIYALKALHLICNIQLKAANLLRIPTSRMKILFCEDKMTGINKSWNSSFWVPTEIQLWFGKGIKASLSTKQSDCTQRLLSKHWGGGSWPRSLCSVCTHTQVKILP